MEEEDILLIMVGSTAKENGIRNQVFGKVCMLLKYVYVNMDVWELRVIKFPHFISASSSITALSPAHSPTKKPQ